MFRHAGMCGAHKYDETKVNSVEFATYKSDDSQTFLSDGKLSAGSKNGRPVSASWSKSDGSTGKVPFEYLADACGRASVISPKYLKNGTYNEGLRNIAISSYWKGVGRYVHETTPENQPFFGGSARSVNLLPRHHLFSIELSESRRRQRVVLVHPSCQQLHVRRRRHAEGRAPNQESVYVESNHLRSVQKSGPARAQRYKPHRES